MDTPSLFSPHSRSNTSLPPFPFPPTSQQHSRLQSDPPSTPSSSHLSLDTSDLFQPQRLQPGTIGYGGGISGGRASRHVHEHVPHGDCIMQATEEHLTRFQNAPYLLLRQQVERLQRRVLELDIENSVYKKNYEDIVSRLPQLVGMDADASILPPPTLPLNQRGRIVLGHGWDFPTSVRPEGSKLKFWDSARAREVKTHGGGGKSGAHDDSINTAQRYLEHADGEVISGYVATDARKRMRACIHSLIWSGQATPTEAGLGHEARAYIHVMMARGFDFLRFCDNGTWKTDCLLRQMYTSVVKTFEIEGAAPKKRKREDSSDEVSKRSQALPPRPSTSSTSSTPAPAMQPAPLLVPASTVQRTPLSLSIARTPSPLQQPVVLSLPWTLPSDPQDPLTFTAHPPRSQDPPNAAPTLRTAAQSPPPSVAPPLRSVAPPLQIVQAQGPSTTSPTTSHTPVPSPQPGQGLAFPAPVSHTAARTPSASVPPLPQVQAPALAQAPASGTQASSEAPSTVPMSHTVPSPPLTSESEDAMAVDTTLPASAPPAATPSSQGTGVLGAPQTKAIIPVKVPFAHLRPRSGRSGSAVDSLGSNGPPPEQGTQERETEPSTGQATSSNPQPKTQKRRILPKDNEEARLAYQEGVASEQNMYLRRLINQDPNFSMTYGAFKTAFKNLPEDTLRELKKERLEVSRARRAATKQG